ncbi:hypothetical protein KUTeg_010080 [Tegillarca granosa]|uniref:Sodium/calcium exchanger membrane region domain-containing protein n=1 Tax=Tegillarca granosa TaxID=220873 RepID=A0ABQ9F8N9_TEGGR|nr:hypothetical protein KUTeg_010080 [Tegillarca granosa]
MFFKNGLSHGIGLVLIATFSLYYFYFQTFVAPVPVISGQFSHPRQQASRSSEFSLRKLLWTDVGDGISENVLEFGHGLKFQNQSFKDNGTSFRDDSDDDVECGDVHKQNKSEKCNFVKVTDDCQIDEGFIDYTTFVYCDFDPDLGVTFLAFGNGAPDIFSAIAAIGNAKNGDAGLAIGALFGAGVFVTTVVAGTIAVICPFDAMQRPFLRDVIFYMAATFWTFWILWKKEITKIEAIGFILMYIGYVIVVLLGRYIYQKQKPPTLLSETTVPAPETTVPAPGRIQSSDDDEDENKVVIERDRERQPLLRPGHGEFGQSTASTYIGDSDKTPLQDFLAAINPVDTENWSEMNLIKKIYEVFKAFAYLGFIVAVVWIYSIANEIVNILQTFGIVFNISNAILGLTLLAWGNSIGDFIADTVMARQGFPRMGISACFGGPLFITWYRYTIYYRNYKARWFLQAAFLMLSLITSLIVVPLSRFHMSRPYGITLLVLYVVFLVVAILAETGTINSCTHFFLKKKKKKKFNLKYF